MRGFDIANEVAEIAGDVHHVRIGTDVALQECSQLAPDRLFAGLVLLVEPLFVNLLEDDRRQLVRRAFVRGLVTGLRLFAEPLDWSSHYATSTIANV